VEIGITNEINKRSFRGGGGGRREACLGDFVDPNFLSSQNPGNGSFRGHYHVKPCIGSFNVTVISLKITAKLLFGIM
jgi:hypothetical protein